MTDEAAKPAPGAGLWKYHSFGKTQCVLCGKVITDGVLSCASHARSHVRKGEAEEFGYSGSKTWRVK